jgi:DNA-binding transcriptional ArsR family regulator
MTRFWENGSGHASPCPHARKLLKLLGCEVSLEILVQLANNEKDVSEVARDLELDVTTISRGLKALHGFAMVEVKRVKSQHLYRLAPGIKVSVNGVNVCVTAKAADGARLVLRMPRSSI